MQTGHLFKEGSGFSILNIRTLQYKIKSINQKGNEHYKLLANTHTADVHRSRSGNTQSNADLYVTIAQVQYIKILT